jgi:hypothetical protein
MVVTTAGSLEEFSVVPSVCRKFVETVASRYHDANPYHNFCHAADVMQVRCGAVR